MNSTLRPHRGLSRDQRLAGLVGGSHISTELPQPFKTRRGPTPIWSDESCEMWADLLRAINAQGKPYSCLMPLPGESFILIEEDGTQSIDGIELNRQLPLRDIAVWLSNSNRRATVSDWKSFLIALSSVTRELPPMQEEQWGPWMGRAGWAGFDAPNLLMSECIRGSSTHPYFEWIGKQCDESPDERTSIGYIARMNQNLMCEVEGRPSEAWLEILEDDEKIAEMFNSMVAPRLVVMDYELHFLVLRNGRPCTIPITIDPKVWRVLVSWALEPPDSRGAEKLRYLFWCWSSEYEDWRPSTRQLRSTKMLRSTIESLGKHSSFEPVRYTRNSSGIPVQGKSGLCYLVIPSWTHNKFIVEATPNWESLAKARLHGIQICIDVSNQHDVPAGDFAVSYLLHLRDDLGSRKMIHTLGSLLHAAESTTHYCSEGILVSRDGRGRRGKDDSSLFAWWERVGENFADLAEMEPDDWEEVDFEEMEEEVFEEIVEDESEELGAVDVVRLLPDVGPVSEGDLQGLHDMLERLMRDVQQLQEG